MSKRTKEQILDQAVYAAACVARHYGPGFNSDGVALLREKLSELPWYTDAEYWVDVYPGDEFEDFHLRITWPSDWDKLEFPLKDV